MASQHLQPVVLDTTVLRYFSSTDSVSFVTAVLKSPVVVPTVRDELERGLEMGHDYLDGAVGALDDEHPFELSRPIEIIRISAIN